MKGAFWRGHTSIDSSTEWLALGQLVCARKIDMFGIRFLYHPGLEDGS